MAFCTTMLFGLTVSAEPITAADPSSPAGPQPVATPAAEEVLSLDEAARLLEVAEQELEALAMSGAIPGRRIGGEWRFLRARLLSWLAGVEARSEPGPELRSDDLARTRGRGPDPDPADEGVIGERPPGEIASDVFLRNRRVLLAPGQLVVEPQIFFTRADSPDIQFLSFTGTTISGAVGSAANIEQNVTTVNMTARYGLADGVEGFGGASFQDRRIKQEGEPEEVDTELRSVLLGMRATLLREARYRPDLVVGIQGLAPTGDSSWAVGGSLVALKSADPLALFVGLEYLHTFSRDFDEPRKLEPEDTFSAQAGYVFAVTDETSLSTSLQGVFVLDSNFDAGTIDSTEEFALRLGLTQRLRADLFVEPSVAFSLNGPGSFVTFGLRFPWIAHP